VIRAYRIPGGNYGMWIVGGIGCVGAFLTLIVGLFPPEQIELGNERYYPIFMLVGIILFCLVPKLILKFKKPEWNKPLSHEKD